MPLVTIDFREASSGGEFRERNVEEGDYLFVVKSSVSKESKAGNAQLVFTVTSPQIAGGKYPIYCPLTGGGVFKIKQLMEACGFATEGKSVAKFNTDKLNGKQFAATLVDDEYNGKIKSKIEAIFSPAELDGAPGGNGPDGEVRDDEADEEELASVPVSQAKKAAPRKAAAKPAEPVEDTDDGEEFDPNVDLDEI